MRRGLRGPRNVGNIITFNILMLCLCLFKWFGPLFYVLWGSRAWVMLSCGCQGPHQFRPASKPKPKIEQAGRLACIILYLCSSFWRLPRIEMVLVAEGILETIQVTVSTWGSARHLQAPFEDLKRYSVFNMHV